MSRIKEFLYSDSLSDLTEIPDWVIFAYQSGILFYDLNENFHLKTLGGSVPINIGDFIICEPSGVISVRRKTS